MTLPTVSVIIPVYNDSERLKLCLEALKNQTYPKNLYEIIVVDNGSRQDLNEIFEQNKTVIFVLEKEAGPYAARNKGISIAKGEILAFTDSDCIPAGNWIEKGVKNLQSIPHCGLVTGKIIFFYKGKPSFIELYDSILYFQQKKSLEKYRYGAAANLFTFKNVIDRVGHFKAYYKSCGDVEWGQRVFSYGYEQIYSEEVLVAHPACRSWRQIIARTTRIAGGSKLSNFGKKIESFLQNIKMILADKRVPSIIKKIKIILFYFFDTFIRYLEILRIKLFRSHPRK